MISIQTKVQSFVENICYILGYCNCLIRIDELGCVFTIRQRYVELESTSIVEDPLRLLSKYETDRCLFCPIIVIRLP